MSDRVSTQIREKFVSIIAGGSTLAGARVYPSRVYPYETLPAVGVFLREDRWDEGNDTIGSGATDREARVVTELRVKASADADQIIEELLGQIEALIFANVTLDGLASGVLPPDATFEFAAQEKPVIAATVVWPVKYAIVASNPWVDVS